MAITTGVDASLVETNGTYDFQIGEDGDILTADAFDAAIIVSLFTNERADPSEVSSARLRRGWVGNESSPGFEIGGKLWLFEQSRLLQSTRNGIADAAQASLKWMVEDKIADSVSATAEVIGGALRLEITLERPASQVEKRYFDLWQNTGSAGLGS
jgi:phage gp46-like protein